MLPTLPNWLFGMRAAHVLGMADGLPKSGQVQERSPKDGRIRAEFGLKWLTTVELGPKLTALGATSAEFGPEFGPESAKFDRRLADFWGRARPKSAEFVPESARFDTCWAALDPFRAEFGKWFDLRHGRTKQDPRLAGN